MIPGWIDLQVNGYKGIDFSDSNLSLNDIELNENDLYKVGFENASKLLGIKFDDSRLRKALKIRYEKQKFHIE